MYIGNESGQQNHLNDEQKTMGFFHLLSFTSILERLLGHGPWLFSWEGSRQNCGKKYFLARGDVFFFGLVGNSAKEGGNRG